MKQLQTLGLSISLALSALPAHSDTLLGVFEGNQGWSMQKVEALEDWQAKKNAVVTLFTGWSETSAQLLFDYQLPNIWQNGNVPLITWEPHYYEGTPEDIETLIAAGVYDDYITNWASRLKQFLAGLDGELGTNDDRRAFLRFAHEMNGDWYYWSALSGLNTPDDYVSMWRHVWEIVEAQGITRNHLQWMWTVSASDYGGFTAEQYYPGDDYVDWLGIDGYNFGDDFSWSYWRTPTQIFESMRQRLVNLAPNKPIAIPEVATTSMTQYGHDPFRKDTWIAQLDDYIEGHNIGLISWFNLDKESDWRVFDGTVGAEEADDIKYYPAYKTLVNKQRLVAADYSNPQLITDSQFKGEFAGDSEVNEFVRSCEVSYALSAQWSGGYVAKVSVDANFVLPDDWSMEWQFADTESVSYSWRASLTQQSQTVSIAAPSWWMWMPENAMPDFGFVAAGEGITPDAVSLEGVQCLVSS